MTIDPLKLARIEIREEKRGGWLSVFGPSRRTWYVVEPNKMYPIMIAYIQEQITKRRKPKEEGLRKYYDLAKKVPVEGWIYALDGVEGCPPQFLSARRMALEIARLWFTQLLWKAAGEQPIGLHLLEDRKYKL